MNFSKRLKELRVEKAMTQKQLAEALSIGYRTIQDYEYGVIEPTVSVLVKLANFFGCSVDYLIGCSDKKCFVETTNL